MPHGVQSLTGRGLEQGLLTESAERSGEIADPPGTRRGAIELFVHTDAPAPHGDQTKSGRTEMSLATLGRQIRRISPTLLTLAMAILVVGFATVGVVA